MILCVFRRFMRLICPCRQTQGSANGKPRNGSSCIVANCLARQRTDRRSNGDVRQGLYAGFVLDTPRNLILSEVLALQIIGPEFL